MLDPAIGNKYGPYTNPGGDNPRPEPTCSECGELEGECDYDWESVEHFCRGAIQRERRRRRIAAVLGEA